MAMFQGSGPSEKIQCVPVPCVGSVFNNLHGRHFEISPSVDVPMKT